MTDGRSAAIVLFGIGFDCCGLFVRRWGLDDAFGDQDLLLDLHLRQVPLVVMLPDGGGPVVVITEECLLILLVKGVEIQLVISVKGE